MFYRKIVERGQMALRVWRDKKKYLDGRKPVRGGMALKGETCEEERKSQKVWQRSETRKKAQKDGWKQGEKRYQYW